MGVRIHKVLGFGTDRLAVKDGKLDDPRFDVDRSGFSRMSPGRVDSYRNEIMKAFAEEFVDARAERLFEYAKEEVQRLDSKNGSATGPPGVPMGVYCELENEAPAMVLVPPNVEGWVRVDDVIDYHEHDGSALFRYLKVVEIFPLAGEMRRYRGERRFDWEPATMGGAHYNLMVGRWDPNMKPLASGDDLDDLLENWRPTLPCIILAWIQMQEQITDKRGFADMLRPCVYVYWS